MSEANPSVYEPVPMGKGEKIALGATIAFTAGYFVYELWRTRKEDRLPRTGRQTAGDFDARFLDQSREPTLHLSESVPKGSRLFVLRHGMPWNGDIHEDSVVHLKGVTSKLFSPERAVNVVPSPIARAKWTAAHLVEVLAEMGVSADLIGEKQELQGCGPDFAISDEFISGLFADVSEDGGADVVMITHGPVLEDFAMAMGNLAYTDYDHLAGYQFDNTGNSFAKTNVLGQIFQRSR